MPTDNKTTKLNEESFTSYKDVPNEHCWYDGCNCDDILIADCDALTEENNKGVGRFACMMKSQTCYNTNFFSSFMKKLACQLDHYIQNICALWDMVQCMGEYLKSLGDMGTVSVNYIRNTSVSSATFYHPITDEYDIDIYMDSTTGVVAGESDDQRRKMTDRKYRVYLRWCADGNDLDANVDNTMEFTVYTSDEQFTQDMMDKRAVHWQMKGVTDGAMEMSDSIIVPEGKYIRVHVTPANQSKGTFRLHQFKVEYTPIIDQKELPKCLQFTDIKTDECNCKEK